MEVALEETGGEDEEETVGGVKQREERQRERPRGRGVSQREATGRPPITARGHGACRARDRARQTSPIGKTRNSFVFISWVGILSDA